MINAYSILYTFFYSNEPIGNLDNRANYENCVCRLLIYAIRVVGPQV